VVLSPDGRTLVTIDIDGFALIINFLKKVVIAHFNFKAPVTAFAFSPDSKFILVATEGKKVKIFETPSVTHKVYSPMVLYKKYGNLHSQEIVGACWSSDSRFFITWSEDLTMKMMSLHKIEGYLPFTFGGHKKGIVRVFFSEDSQRIFTVASNGTILIWKWTDERSEGVQRNLEFQQQKMGKRLKTGAKPNVYTPVEEDREHYSELE
jgi:periodic tryptophan protein 2